MRPDTSALAAAVRFLHMYPSPKSTVKKTRIPTPRRDCMKTIICMAVFLIAPCFAQSQDVAGDWQGTLSAGGTELRLVLHITKAPDSSLKATIDSVDQNANGIPVNSITLKDSKLNLDVSAVHGTYEGKVSPDAKTISGTWTQGQPLPLEFKRTT